MQKILRQNPLFALMIVLAFWQLLSGGGKLALLAKSPFTFVILIISLILAITVHEFCHALAADKLGDPTPRRDGRISLNPLKHLDPLGTLMIIFTNFGWGKPVEFDPYNLRHPRKDGAIIAACGPLSNLAMALLCALLVRILPVTTDFAFYLLLFLYTFGTLNITLAIFNLIPIRPLDGSHIIRAFIPAKSVRGFDQIMNNFGQFFLLLFIFPVFGGTAPINYIMTPLIDLLTNLLFPLI
jgi:Zn-dependent protease